MQSDHHGRLAVRTVGDSTNSSDYIVCDDGKTLCTLSHKSLCGKVPVGQSAHGGCTHEEVLVPIFVISSKKEYSQWTAKIKSKEVSDSSPFISYTIKGLSSIEIPGLEYNGNVYAMKNLGNDVYQSEKITLSTTENSVTLIIGDKKQTDTIEVKLGAEENDLFDF